MAKKEIKKAILLRDHANRVSKSPQVSADRLDELEAARQVDKDREKAIDRAWDEKVFKDIQEGSVPVDLSAAKLSPWGPDASKTSILVGADLAGKTVNVVGKEMLNGEPIVKTFLKPGEAAVSQAIEVDFIQSAPVEVPVHQEFHEAS